MNKFKPNPIPPSQITPREAYFNRREVLAGALAAGAIGLAHADAVLAESAPPAAGALKYSRNTQYSVTDAPNTFEDITSYNNFYEFGTDKSDPKANAGSFKTQPWTVTVDGEAEVKGKFTLEDILKPHPFEERIYRFRCVEAWSMIVPWLGFPLADLVKRFKPTSKARYVQFTTLLDPKQMPGQRYPVLRWPYVEGLRMDEAMHPLTLMVTGLYGKTLPNQDGAPLRLIVPWKYGFKGVKSIVKISFVEREPRNTWAVTTPGEYGFYANVNPAVDHPRWSQATERRIGGGLFAKRQQTLPFNGYADEVASLYKGMDLRRYF
ncbi:MAG TPA: protein-methionine-sulfoxide reductase catalytic subunit MsrP [Steroidobacteraceae bacterium]|jgi:sulfoxide reductase catalytic subunit YedY|nr:protein-methionine-sulfoxide reductase catalytic subunit MsrP [Steroidobacteraceae bacterium]